MSLEFHAINAIFLLKVDNTGCKFQASSVVCLSLSDQAYILAYMGCLLS